ncbi:MAG: TauD/TfdA family dioxygenase [Pseudomonadota bacterium]|nr:TauD/TfdA family dioxygenase [Pseudomonadota bacterium]
MRTDLVASGPALSNNMIKEYRRIEVRRVTPAVGAELAGLDIAQGVDEETFREIHMALMEHGVVFLRDQDVTPEQQRDFAARFGRLRKVRRSAFLVQKNIPEMHILVNDRDRPPNVNHYHSDGIFRAEPEFASMLRAVEVPDAGGDTIFVGMRAAYDDLSADMKVYLEDKQAINDFMKLHGSPKKARSWEGDNWERMERSRRANPPVAHSMVKVHPVTGRKSLYISESFTASVVGLGEDESKGLLDFLNRHCARPEFQCRFQWRPGSIAFWDNRTTQHYAVADYWPEHRLMNRVSIETDAIGGQAAATTE